MRPTKQRQRGRQKGEIQLARTLLIVGILLAMLVLPLWQAATTPG